MANKNGYSSARTGRGTEALTQKKEDRARMEAAKAVHDQLNSKTVGPPLAATGLIGDQAPESTIGVGDFDQVKNQIYLQSENSLALDTLNAMGQITNMQSQSGPIPGTGKIALINQAVSSGVTYDIFTPNAGEVWELISADFNATLSSGDIDSIQLKIKENSTDEEVMIAENLGDNFDTFKDFMASPVYVDANLTVTVRGNDANLTNLAVRLLLIRIR